MCLCVINSEVCVFVCVRACVIRPEVCVCARPEVCVWPEVCVCVIRSVSPAAVSEEELNEAIEAGLDISLPEPGQCRPRSAAPSVHRHRHNSVLSCARSFSRLGVSPLEQQLPSTALFQRWMSRGAQAAARRTTRPIHRGRK